MALHGHCRSPIMGQPDSNKGSYQKCQFLIVTLLAACHMGFVRCPYSNAVLKVWGEAIQRDSLAVYLSATVPRRSNRFQDPSLC